MDWDDVTPHKTAGGDKVSIGDDLSRLSIAELNARIGALEGEINRVRDELSKKQAHETAASAIFRSSGDPD